MSETGDLDTTRYLDRAFQPAAQDTDEIAMMVRLPCDPAAAPC